MNWPIITFCVVWVTAMVVWMVCIEYRARMARLERTIDSQTAHLRAENAQLCGKLLQRIRELEAELHTAEKALEYRRRGWINEDDA